jgi:copper chaperone NosL
MRKTRRTTRVFQSLLLGLAGAALFASITLPIWRITLDAPQYPEGMGMLIWASTLTGEKPHDLTIINQLTARECAGWC